MLCGSMATRRRGRERVLSFDLTPAILAICCATFLLGPAGLAQGVRINSAQAPAQLFGVLVDSSGKPVVGAEVLAELMWDSSHNRKLGISRAVHTRSGGEFGFASLQPGLYRVCPSIPGSDLLPNCIWSDQQPTVALNGGQLWTGLRLIMQRGQRVVIRIDDPGNELKVKDVPGAATGSEKRKNAFVQVGVVSKKGFHPAKFESEDAGGETHMLVVPRNFPVSLSIRGTKAVRLSTITLAGGLAEGAPTKTGSY